jgi:hypothetical protein
MLRFLLRLIGLCLLATAFFFLVYDGTKSIANHNVDTIKLGVVWAMVDQTSLVAVQSWFKQKALWAWDPYVVKVLDLPTWIVLVFGGLVLILLGRKKRPLIGYARN